MKKSLTLILALVLILYTFIPVLGTSPEQKLYEQSGEILKSIGILQGSPSGDLMLDKKLKRQDMVVLISRLYKEENAAKKHPVKNTFKDVKSSLYSPYISWAKDKELIEGMSKDNFGFNQVATVQQFQILLLKALGYNEEVKDWKNVPNLSNALGLMKNLTIQSDQEMERGLMATMTLNALGLTIKGGSITLAQKLNIDMEQGDSFYVPPSPYGIICIINPSLYLP